MKKILLVEEPSWRLHCLYVIVLPAVMPFSVPAFVLLCAKERLLPRDGENCMCSKAFRAEVPRKIVVESPQVLHLQHHGSSFVKCQERPSSRAAHLRW
jgi:hypothetical protein